MNQSMIADSNDDLEGLPQFDADDKVRDTFRSLTKRQKIGTQDLEVINIAITYGSKYAVSLLHDAASPDDDFCEIQGYSLGDF